MNNVVLTLRFIIYQCNGDIVFVDKTTLTQEMTISSLDKEHYTQHSIQEAPEYVPGAPAANRDYAVFTEGSDTRPPKKYKEFDMDETSWSWRTYNCGICLSTKVFSDEVRLVWCWNSGIQVAILKPSKNGLEVSRQIAHRQIFFSDYKFPSSPDSEYCMNFSLSQTHLAVYQNKIIVAVDIPQRTHSHLYVMGLETGEYLWRLAGGSVLSRMDSWRISTPVIFHGVLYVIAHNIVLALQLGDNRYKIVVNFD